MKVEDLPRSCGTCLFHRSYKGLNGEVVLTMCEIKQRAVQLYCFCPAWICAVNLPPVDNDDGVKEGTQA